MSNGAIDQCSREDCFVPDTACSAGCMHAADCEHYVSNEESESLSAIDSDDEGFPWTGRPMGVVDLRFVSASQRPHILGIAGAADAGKTTLLCLLFLALYRGRTIGNLAFAGSYTLLGWENIARHLQLNAGEVIQFPPHTSSTGRSAGFLHLRMMSKGNELTNTILTDNPGEWFTAWAKKPSDDTAEGARWIANHADRMLIVADTKALTGEKRGVARQDLEFLFRRVQSDFGVQGVALVWTKVDLPCPETMRNEVENLFSSCFESAPIFETSVPNESIDGDQKTLTQLSRLFEWSLSRRVRKVEVKMPLVRSSDPFLSYRNEQ